MSTPHQQHLLIVFAMVAALASLVATVIRARDRSGILALALSALAFVTVFQLVSPEAIPVRWLTPLQEGDASLDLDLALGMGSHVGPILDRGYRPWLLVGPRRLDVVVRSNLAFAAAAVPMVWWVLRRITGSPVVAGVFLWGWSLSPVVWAHATSEGLGAPIAWWTAALVGTGLSVQQRPDRGAWVLLILAPIVLALHRVELMALAVVPVGLAFGWPALRWPRGRWLAAGLAGCWVLAEAGLGLGGSARWVAQAAHPLDGSVVQIPLFLGALFGPGLGVLAVVGLVGSVRRPSSLLGTGLVLAVLMRVYYAAGHGRLLGAGGEASHFELLRYLGYVAVLVLFVAAEGWRRLSVARLRTALAALVLLPPVPVLLSALPGNTSRSVGVGLGVITPLERDPQREVRAFVAARRAHPDCVFVTQDGQGWWVVVPDRRTADGEPRIRQRVEGDPLASVDASCVLAVEGLACARSTCAPLSGPVLHEEAHAGAPWIHPDHGIGAPERWTWRLRQLR